MIVVDIQKNSLKEQTLQFIRNHQQAFDVEPVYPLRLFEDFVMEVEGDCSIEASCKIELDKLIASRFMLLFKFDNIGKIQELLSSLILSYLSTLSEQKNAT